MSLDALNRRIDKMIASIDPHAKITQGFELPTHLLTAGEQERFTTFFCSIETQCYQDSHIDMRDLTNQELQQTKLWALLLKSLDSEDVAAAAQYRSELAAA